MNRYRSYGNLDDQPQVVGDNSLLGVDEYNAPENIKPGNVQKAVNTDFTSQDAFTRGGFVCLPELAAEAFGSKWNSSANTTSGDAYCITFGNNLFVSGGYYTSGSNYPCVITSPDAITWTQTAIPGAASGFINRIAFANSTFVAGTSSGEIYYSSDGLTWSISSYSAPDRMKGLAYGNGKWVGLCGANIPTNFTPITSTNNGVTWTTGTTQNDFGGATDLFFYNGVFIATTLTSKIVTSIDGITWTLAANLTSYFTPIAITFGNNVFCALGSGGAIAISSNLTNWTLVQGSYTTTTYIFNDIEFFNGRFIGVGRKYSGSPQTTVVLTSIYGTNWTLYDTGVSTSDLTPADQSLANGNNTSVIINTYGAATYEALYSYSAPLQNIYASGIYSDPNNVGQTWIMLVGNASVGFFANEYTGKTISLGNYQVTAQSTIVQANEYVYIFRGPDDKPLYWDGNWNNIFEEVPDTTLPASFLSIPNSNNAVYYQNRLWVVDGNNTIAASDVLAFQDYDPLANEFNVNTGNSDYMVATFPFGQNSLIAFKNKSIMLLQNVEGALTDVTVTEITRQVGLVGINAVTSIGPDLAYVSNQNINLLTLTSTNNSLQHKTLPLSVRIRGIMSRVNWKVGYKISIGYWSNKLYVALPVDNSPVCNVVVVYNFITENWFGEWNFDSTLNMCIQSWQVVDYLGLQRMHAVTEDGRIFVTDEGQNDINGTTVAEISTQIVTRAYDTSNLNHFQRRTFMDMATNRPKVSVAVFTEGASEESTLLTDQTYSRAESWKFNDSAYDLTNVNDDFNRAYRKDYSSGPLAAGSTPGLPTTGLQMGSGIQPQMLQEYRLPLITRRQGRLSWLEITNTQGYLKIMSVGFEARAGQRANLVQV
jgi:hypothetical protein